MTALVMAGGRGRRMGGRVEKPLLKISDRSMLQRVIEVLRASSSVDRIVVASSPNTPATAVEAERLGVENLTTPGAGFEEDMRFAVRKLSLGDVLVISSDLPFVTVGVVEEAVRKYRSSRKPALAVMAEPVLYEKLGSKPGFVFEINGRRLVPVGINILDGRRIGEGELEQVELVIDSEDVALNVNTPRDLAVAERKVRRGACNG